MDGGERMNDRLLGMLLGFPVIVLGFLTLSISPLFFIGLLLYMIFTVIILKISGVLDEEIIIINSVQERKN